ncbi:GAF domain-containing sensor histidine kinase [Aeromicrobium stalagmiti]|uniref:GAF domain-containing sensor histidine kinase n=1 Tax=Aeromicrobium stalagmiti TaxID=2738988 RepID=UPI00156921C4|nr:GAF domain-containing sensor histidine kinase [Aeromicrobium stalagmiti]NRQ48502.1 GAF domain-containing sensor histidine kinase [Aeromicrobium stalagmiti]
MTTHSAIDRDEALEQYAVLSEPAGRDLQGLVDLVAQVCAVPTAAINIITRDQQHQIATAGFDPSVCSRDDSMCALVMTERAPVVVPDASLDPRFSSNAFVTGDIGSVRFYASAPLMTPDGTTLGRLCVFDDVARTLTPEQEQGLMTLAAQVMDVLELRLRTRELERSLAELAMLRDELRRSNRHLTLFAGQVSHDLRSPLTAILATAELLATEPVVETDTDLLSMVSAVNSAGQRMNRMIEEMLDYALQGGQLQLADTAVEHVVSLVLADLAPLVTQKGATVRVLDLPTVTADADMLYSVVLNLLTNALKFVRPDVPPEIEVSATRGPDRWRVTVSDNGVGIPADRRQAVFSLFEREESTVGGHGIGLATTRRLIEAHGGSVGADSSPSGGAAVWFELPD